jgi:hypothetical protein
VDAWDELKTVLTRLRDAQPGTLTQCPTPDTDDSRQPPFAIRLAPWALTAAEDLHRQFGDNVDLTVGALPYPPGRQPHRLPGTGETADLLNPDEIATELDSPAVVSSGHTPSRGHRHEPERQLGLRASAAIGTRPDKASGRPFRDRRTGLIRMTMSPGDALLPANPDVAAAERSRK